MSCANLKSDELRDTTLADYLISVEGDLRIVEGDRVIYEEPSFPILELARSLRRWLKAPVVTDYAFESMSFEEVGVVEVRQSKAGWAFGSVFEGSASSPISREEAEWCIRAFVEQVATELRRVGVDPADVLG